MVQRYETLSRRTIRHSPNTYDAVSKALVLEVLTNLHRILKQFDILLPYLFRHHHPLHQ